MNISNLHKPGPGSGRLGLFLVATFFSALSLQANPLVLPETPVTPEITVLTTVAILLEALGVVFLLRCFRRPRFFILWILGMHAVTFPAFLGLLWFLQEMRPALAVIFAETVVVVVEGAIIHLICCLAPTTKLEFPIPSLLRSWGASLVGNACSFLAFPLLLSLYESIFHT